MKLAAVMLTIAVLKNMLIDMGYCNRLYYTDEWRYQYDKQLAHDIYMELKSYLAENGYDETLCTNLIFLGYPIEPEPYFSEGARAAYYAYFEDYFGEKVDAMPAFPERGSIQYLKSEEIGLHYLIVKLGPHWKSAIQNPANHGN